MKFHSNEGILHLADICIDHCFLLLLLQFSLYQFFYMAFLFSLQRAPPSLHKKWDLAVFQTYFKCYASSRVFSWSPKQIACLFWNYQLKKKPTCKIIFSINLYIAFLSPWERDYITCFYRCLILYVCLPGYFYNRIFLIC